MIANVHARLLSALRNRFKKYSGSLTSEYKSTELVNIEGQEVSDIIANAIRNKQRFVLSRFGSEEIKWYVQYKLLSKSYFFRIYYYITCRTDTWKSDGRIINNLTFKPKSDDMSKYFISTMDDAIPTIDLLGSWLKLEKSVEVQRKLMCDKFAYLVDIEPYYHPIPWSAALKGKKVLVIHPMVYSIKSQYSKKHLLFKNPYVLPDFELITLQAKYFDDPIFDTWDKIFEYYIKEVNLIEFDVAIIGCGPWGMPLAGVIKNMGKVAIHLGGATQVLFGIIGNRWETQYPGFTEKFVNEHWVRPINEETPEWAKTYDKNSYW